MLFGFGIFIRASGTDPIVHFGQLELPQTTDAVHRQRPVLAPVIDGVLDHAQVLGDLLDRNHGSVGMLSTRANSKSLKWIKPDGTLTSEGCFPQACPPGAVARESHHRDQAGALDYAHRSRSRSWRRCRYRTSCSRCWIGSGNSGGKCDAVLPMHAGIPEKAKGPETIRALVPCNWWSRGESNPRPEALHSQVYILSLPFAFSAGVGG